MSRLQSGWVGAIVGLGLFLPPGTAHADSPPALKERIAAVTKKLDAELPALLDLYKQIHAHPELSLQEEKTAARLAQELKGLGFEVATGVGGTGIVCVLKNGIGPTVLVRTDMDGLPVVEQTGVPYASKERGRDRSGTDV